jgi:hypothetical protein
MRVLDLLEEMRARAPREWLEQEIDVPRDCSLAALVSRLASGLVADGLSPTALGGLRALGATKNPERIHDKHDVNVDGDVNDDDDDGEPRSDDGSERFFDATSSVVQMSAGPAHRHGRPTRLDMLPLDCIARIAAMLPCAQRLLLGSVCRQFACAVRSPIAWRALDATIVRHPAFDPYGAHVGTTLPGSGLAGAVPTLGGCAVSLVRVQSADFRAAVANANANANASAIENDNDNEYDNNVGARDPIRAGDDEILGTLRAVTVACAHAGRDDTDAIDIAIDAASADLVRELATLARGNELSSWRGVVVHADAADASSHASHVPRARLRVAGLQATIPSSTLSHLAAFRSTLTQINLAIDGDEVDVAVWLTALAADLTGSGGGGGGGGGGGSSGGGTAPGRPQLQELSIFPAAPAARFLNRGRAQGHRRHNNHNHNHNHDPNPNFNQHPGGDDLTATPMMDGAVIDVARAMGGGSMRTLRLGFPLTLEAAVIAVRACGGPGLEALAVSLDPLASGDTDALGIVVAGTCPGLRVFECPFATGGAAFATMLRGCPRLVKFDTVLLDDTFDWPSADEPLLGMRSLRVFVPQHASLGSTHALDRLVAACPGLAELTFVSSSVMAGRPPDGAWLPALARLRGLRKLVLPRVCVGSPGFFFFFFFFFFLPQRKSTTKQSPPTHADNL